MSLVVVANPEVHLLAEGPVWDPLRAELLWVDIHRGLVLRGRLEGEGRIEIVEKVVVDTTVGAVAPAVDGGWIAAGAEQLFLRAPGEAPRPWRRLLDSGGTRRLNDGKPGPAGEYVVGSLSLAGPSTTEELFAVTQAGDIRVVDADLTLSNGLAWSVDGTRMFTVDTEVRRISVRAYDAATGATGPREPFVELTDGYPDGICLDAEGGLWVAVWGLGQVQRYDPAGRLDRVIDVPAPHTSAVAFAGPDLATLVITTASVGLAPDQLRAFPDSGRLFTTRPGVTGHPLPLWSGPTHSETTTS